MNLTKCTNDIHTKSNNRVRHCPNCGIIINQKVKPGHCMSVEHEVKRKKGNKFCVDCGDYI